MGKSLTLAVCLLAGVATAGYETDTTGGEADEPSRYVTGAAGDDETDAADRPATEPPWQEDDPSA